MSVEKILSVKVTIHDENGTIYTRELVGDNAKKWYNEVKKRLSDYYDRHNEMFPSFEWEIEVIKENKG